jgi:GH25 family lysozyme M1 (1,4-beta-N-acetylmuramidase)
VVRVTKCALVVLVGCLPVAISAVPAVAAPSTPAISHPQDDWAGAQIARHEGVTPQAESPIDANLPPIVGAPVPDGLDVSSHQGNVDWARAAGAGGRFAYVKATESATYVNPFFTQQFQGARAAGLVTGAYHFATPDTSDGASQADYFVAHGGGWSADGRTLPPAVDLEYNPYGQQCYGKPPAALGTWVRAFVGEVRARTGRLPAIYTSVRWWSMCMGGNATFGADPLWIARFNNVVGPLPPGWTTQTIWQYADSGPLPGDQDSFNGSMDQLRALARG